MRVLMVAGRYPPGHCGVGDYTEQLANALAAIDKVQVGVLTSSLITSEKKGIGPVELIDKVASWHVYQLPKIMSTILSWKPDLVHIQYPSQGYTSTCLPSILPLACRLLGIKVVLTWHEPHVNNKKHRFKSYLYYLSMCIGAAGLIFVREDYTALLSNKYKEKIKKIPQLFVPNASPLPTSSLDVIKYNETRMKYKGKFDRLIVFFGFVYPNKGVELIFDIADTSSDVVVIAGSVADQKYGENLLGLALSKGWKSEQVKFTGFISPQNAADLLAVADAVVLPFLDGGGEWNTSIHSALAQGTYVVTTSSSPRGDEPERNLNTSAPSDKVAMRTALKKNAGRRTNPISTANQWKSIASKHSNFYKKILSYVERDFK